MAHNEPSHLDLSCLTISLLILHKNIFLSDTLLKKKKKKKKKKAEDKCRLKFGNERVKGRQLFVKIILKRGLL